MTPAIRTLIARFERDSRRPIVVASHPRSGTHLLLDTLRLHFPACSARKVFGESLHHLYFDLDGVDKWDKGFPGRLASRCARPLFKTHATADLASDYFRPEATPFDADLISWLRRNAVFLYAYRDGRQSLCSLHNFMREFDPAARVPFSEFIRQKIGGLSRPAAWAAHVEGWIQQSSAYLVSMEGLLKFPARVLPGIAEKVEMPFDSHGRLLPHRPRSIFFQRLTRLFTRHPQSTAITNDEIVQPWRSTFTPRDREFFAAETGSALIRLGYEDSTDWVEPRLDNVPRYPAGLWNLPLSQPPHIGRHLTPGPFLSLVGAGHYLMKAAE